VHAFFNVFGNDARKSQRLSAFNAGHEGSDPVLYTLHKCPYFSVQRVPPLARYVLRDQLGNGTRLFAGYRRLLGMVIGGIDRLIVKYPEQTLFFI